MNADRLLALYEKVAEAPDAVSRLRRFVLDLAVRGKLVAQDAGDEPASELLKRIATEKARLVKAKAIRKPRAVSPLEPEDPPFPLSRGWAWTQIAELGIISPRNEADDTLEGSFVPMPMIAAEYGVANGHEPRPWGEIKKGYTHFAEGDVGLAKITPCFENGKSTVFRNLTGGVGAGTTELHVVRPLFVEADYIVLFLKSPQFIETGIPKMTGTAGQKRVPTEYFTSSPFPLPPLAEQRRIVAKVEELMALLDRLEAARSAREATRDRLTAASLARLTAPYADPAEFPANARFALATLPAFTTRPDQIKPLRQTILNLAVRGKLVDQDPNDEPASEFLKRIAAQKARLVKSGKIRKQKTLPPIGDKETSFKLPSGWTWVRLGDLSQFVTSGSRDWAKFYANEGAIFVRMGNLSKDHYRLRLENIQRVNPPASGEGTRTRLKGGDILISITGDVGMLGLIPEDFGDAYINQHTAMVRPMPEIRGRYLAELFRSPFAQDQFNAPQRGIKNSFRLTDITQFVVPLPPLAEQHRIVAKVDALMALCDRLEAALTTADTTRARLLEALLHEALAPAAEAVTEAAE
ncbi:restriction endonuclease subunit S [Roseovarius sp. D22-M7]|uniref:restriction endonuclease subunit S n=1 Tax=Roseovarius sp. D22-M7 TaxID=3127116 RepID=UPI0030103DF7